MIMDLPYRTVRVSRGRNSDVRGLFKELEAEILKNSENFGY